MKKLTALLGLASITLHNSNIFGTGKNYAKFDEEQLQKIEDGLAKTGTEEDAQTIADLQNDILNFQNSETSVQEALTEALQLNGIDAVEGQSVAEAITALGAQCKQYGDAKATHTLPQNDGKENEEDADPVYGFEQVLNDESKYAKL